MRESDFKTVFSKRLRYYLSMSNITQAELANRLHVGTSSVSNWCNGIKVPRADKVDALCEIFQCRRSDLTSEDNNSQSLSQHEWDFICKYRIISLEARKMLDSSLEAAYETAVKLSKEGSVAA